MPPKAKPKKLTKKELLALQEEQRRKDEEERKKREEEEEKQRKILEEQRRKEEERLAAEEKARLKEEEQELEGWRNQILKEREEQVREMRKVHEWDRYMKCSSKPDAIKENELSTFITQYNESPRVTELKIDEALQQIQYAESVVEDVIAFQQRAYAEGRVEDSQRLLKQVLQIRQINDRKIEEISSHLCIYAEFLYEQKLDEISKRLQSESPNKNIKSTDDKQKTEIYKIYPPLPDIRYGVWINPHSKSSYRHKPIDFLGIGIQCEVPRNYMSQSIIMKALWTSYDSLTSPEYKQNSKDIVMGGVLNVECLEYLPAKVKTANWTLKFHYDVEESIKRLPYPSQDSNAQTHQNIQPVKVSYTLPPYLLIYPNDHHRVVVYDSQQQKWTSEYIVDDVKYEADKKLLYFSTIRLAPCAYVQEKCTDYPYVSWKIRCVKPDTAYIDIQGKRDTFKFQVTAGFVMLRNRNEPELKHLVNKKMPTGLLLSQLSKSGIHLQPHEDDANDENIVKKNPAAEATAIAEIVFAVRSFFIQSSRFSGQINKDKILVRIKENLEYDEEFLENQEKDWKTICFQPGKCSIIKSRDSQATCNENLLEETVTHSTLELLLKKHDLAEQKVLDKMRDLKSILFMDTLSRFLNLTKLLSFTSGILPENQPKKVYQKAERTIPNNSLLGNTSFIMNNLNPTSSSQIQGAEDKKSEGVIQEQQGQPPAEGEQQNNTNQSNSQQENEEKKEEVPAN
ncbi:hypothetical protein ABPG72_010997 [Tetrahymena utriculariae]